MPPARSRPPNRSGRRSPPPTRSCGGSGRGVAATARSSAISRSRCWIDRPIVLATTNIAMNSASPPNAAVTGISIVRVCWSSGYSRPAARVAGQHLGAARGGAQARGVEARSGEHADRVDRPGCPASRAACASVTKIAVLLRDRVAWAGDADDGDRAGGLGRCQRQPGAERGRVSGDDLVRSARARGRRSARTASAPRCSSRGRRRRGSRARRAPTRRRSPPGRPAPPRAGRRARSSPGRAR